MEDLFNPATILIHIINAAILLAAMYFLLYKPVRRFTGARAQQIQEQLDGAVATQAQAENHLTASRQKLADVDKEAAAAASQAARVAQGQAQDILAAAREQAEKIVQEARQEAGILLNNAHEAMAEEAAGLAVEIASKLRAREVKAEDHQQLIDEFLKKVG